MLACGIGRSLQTAHTSCCQVGVFDPELSTCESYGLYTSQTWTLLQSDPQVLTVKFNDGLIG